MSFRLLHVCTGNICRSPIAEHLTRAGLQERLGERAHAFEIASAGTMGFTGESMEPFALTTLRGLGQDGSAFRARELNAALVEGADLVLGATREHRAAAVVLHPRASRWTFTLREFDRLVSAADLTDLPADPVDRARAVVAAAAAQRGLVRADRPEDDDVTDPYRGPEAGFVACGALLHETLRRPLDALAGR